MKTLVRVDRNAKILTVIHAVGILRLRLGRSVVALAFIAPLTDIMKIVSGGQTGVDRAALDVALKLGVECGGWCPAGRRDEVGVIPNHYPVQELPNAGPDERTLQNVKDSDATLIIYFETITGGTEFTLESCRQLRRPNILIDAGAVSVEDAGRNIAAFTADHDVRVLNVAGPRQSEWPGGYDYAFRAPEILVGGL